jgi:ribosomal protein L11 methyltransferase
MDYTEVRFYNDVSMNEIIIAWLGENDFDMFEERADGVNAYIVSKNFNENNLIEIISNIPGSGKNIRYETTFIEDQNWNKKWESNFEPVVVADQVYIRAPFHSERKDFRYEIVIEPKMSFGTGHHATTASMIELMLTVQFKNRKVLDMGCGTGVLAILAERLGAKAVTAIDIEEWAYFNSIENCERNHTATIKVFHGDVNHALNTEFDVILANINRNILLNDIPAYTKSLRSGGELLLSGILISDKEIINDCAVNCGLTFVTEVVNNKWLALHYKKN